MHVNKNVEAGMPSNFSILSTSTQGNLVNVQNEQLRKLLEPRPVRAWANAAVVYAKVQLEGAQHQPRFVPPIDLITGVATERKAKEFVAVWRIIRFDWLNRMYGTRAPPKFATRKAWKSFTAGVFSNATIQPNNETSIARVRFAEFLGFKKIMALPRENFTFVKDEVPGSIDEKITVEMVRDTVRELADLNFFFDMFEIEYRRTYDAPDEIRDRMWPVTSPLSLTFPKDIPRSQLADRAAWLTRVRDFIKCWPGKKPEGFDLHVSDRSTVNEVTALEKAVADFYCSNVTYILRRRPVLPRYE